MRVAWPLLILVALIGWGYAGACLTRRFAGVEPASLGDTLALGLALVLAIFGVIVAFGVFSSLVVNIGIAGGVASALAELLRRVGPARGALTSRHLVDASVALTLIAAVLVLALWGTAHFLWNPCDDDSAYLYLAKRLVVVGDLLDPMNNRRLTSLGGMSALQAVFLVRLPDSFLPLPDLFLGPLLILFGLWRSRWRRWAIGGVVATVLVTLFPTNLGPSNTSPVLIPVGLGIAACSIALEMRANRTTIRAGIVYACLLGLVVGSVTTLRPQFGVPLGLVAVVMACWPPLDFGVVQRLAGLGAGLAVALGGWAAASWRAVGTPLFPIISGNLDPAWPANGPAGGPPSLTALIGRLVPSLINPPWGLALLLSIGALAFVLTRPQIAELYRHWGLRLQFVAAAASIGMVLFLLHIYWASGPPSAYERFWAPMVVTAILIPLVLINRTRAEHSKVAAATAFAVLLVLGSTLTVNPIEGGLEVLQVARYTIAKVPNSPDRYANVQAEYAQAAGLIPAGSKVLAAVDVPSLLLGRDFELNTLDIAGSTSPSPHLPYFRGTQAKLAWLREHGYDYVIAVDPTASSCLYNSQLQAEDSIGQHGLVYQAWAPFFMDWFAFLADVSDQSVASSTRVENLIVVKL